MTFARWLMLAGTPNTLPAFLKSQIYEFLEQDPLLEEADHLPPSDNGDADPELPAELPILPLRGMVVYPYTGVPLTVSPNRYIQLVDDVSNTEPRLIGLLTNRQDSETPPSRDLFSVGTVAMVMRLFRVPDGTVRILVRSIARFRVDEFVQETPHIRARISALPELPDTRPTLEMEALTRTAIEQFQRLGQLVPALPEELSSAVSGVEDPLQLAYTIAPYIRMSISQAQEILESDTAAQKLEIILRILGKEIEVLELSRKIQEDAQGALEQIQREYYLREQMKVIQRELGEADEQTAEVDDFRQKIEVAGLTAEAKKEAERELERLKRLPAAAAEYGVIRTYIETLIALPWQKATVDQLDINNARLVLNTDHYGLTDIKERILEFLAVRKLRLERATENPSDFLDQPVERAGVILLLVGPPGVGKTSLGRSIARALGRKFVRLSLGGVRDEAEIRGHRRTYIGALPGRVLQSLRRVESCNPVFMLDEIDKLGQDFRGDPAAALLEVLDPEQNNEFRDHYLEVAFDLSQVFFIATANDLAPIPSALRDRMEVLELSSYTEREKIAIAEQYLVPRQLEHNGLYARELAFTSDSLATIIRSYTREAGVRDLERQISTVCRKVVTALAEQKPVELPITTPIVRQYLGKPRHYFTEEIASRTSLPGVAVGLAWTANGGDVLFIEATKMPGGKGFMLTGQLGAVMQESAQAALSYVRSQSSALGLDKDFFAQNDLHLHIPAGAVPKDGPSAGVTMATALASLLTERSVHPNLGMTGEITLRGSVLPVGGIKEKVLAAHRAGLHTVLLPKRNEVDLEDIPTEVLAQLQIHLVTDMTEVLQLALAPANIKTKSQVGFLHRQHDSSS
jgi:ATP-dependent Lon protease